MSSSSVKFHYHQITADISDIHMLVKEDECFTPLVQFVQNWLAGAQTFEMQTSGSTGTPQKIRIHRAQITASALMTGHALKLHKETNALLCLDARYIATLMMAARCLVVGMDMIITKPSTDPLSELPGGLEVDFASFVPLQIEHMLASNLYDELQSIRNVLIGGAALSNQLISKLRPFKNNIYQTYGMTETVSHIAMMPLSNAPTTDFFQVLQDIQIDRDEKGCLLIKGPVTRDVWVKTRDVVNIMDNGKFEWLGRVDNLINTGGVKVVPEQVEQSLTPLFDQYGVGNAYFLHGLKDDRLGQKVALFVEGTLNDPDLLYKNICEFIASKYSRYHIPRALCPMARFERTSSGKIKRVATVAAYQPQV